MGLFGFGKKKPQASEGFSFTIEDVFAMRAGGCVVVGQVAGGEVPGLLALAGLPVPTQDLVTTVVVSVLILGATVLLFSEKELASKWGVSILEEGGLVQRTEEEERVGERVEELARTYRLSPREEEVLALLADGKTGRVIQQELFIAEGTFKAHTRHIYEKMGINSRKELFDLLGVGK